MPSRSTHGDPAQRLIRNRQDDRGAPGDERLPGTALFDPEPIGIALQGVRKLTGRPIDDFQDLPAWRQLTVSGARVIRKFRSNVIVPMAFSNLSYLQEVRSGIARFEPQLLHFCLVAPVEVVMERLIRRGTGASPADLAWQTRRAEECCIAHADAAFAEHLPTLGLSAEEVAEELVARIRQRVTHDLTA